jgi:6-phosphogluconolactonase
MAAHRHDFASPDALAEALARAVANDLTDGIATRGTGVLAVSGGSTPKRFLKALSKRTVDWPRVLVTLVDERWVEPSSDRSNAKLVHDLLLTGDAAGARFVPLWSGGEEPTEASVAETNSNLARLPMPFDAVILGMGNDGHTASFFPGGDTLADALTSKGPAVPLKAPGAGEPRITLTLPALLNTGSLYLHIEGGEKASTLDRALSAGPIEDMPVRAVLNQSQTPVHIYFA